MLCNMSGHVAQHVGVSVILGGGNPDTTPTLPAKMATATAMAMATAFATAKATAMVTAATTTTTARW